MTGQAGARFEADIVFADRDVVSAGQFEGCSFCQTRSGCTHITGVAGFGSKPGEPGQDCVWRTVAETGGAERAIERTTDATDARQVAGLDEVVCE